MTNIRNTASPHWRMWLTPESQCLVPFNSFAEYAPEPNPEVRTKKTRWQRRNGRDEMAISMFDQMLFPLACGHDVVLGRLANTETWVCEKCGKPTNLAEPPFKDQLLKDIDTALQIDFAG